MYVYVYTNKYQHHSPDSHHPQESTGLSGKHVQTPQSLQWFQCVLFMVVRQRNKTNLIGTYFGGEPKVMCSPKPFLSHSCGWFSCAAFEEIHRSLGWPIGAVWQSVGRNLHNIIDISYIYRVFLQLDGCMEYARYTRHISDMSNISICIRQLITGAKWLKFLLDIAAVYLKFEFYLCIWSIQNILYGCLKSGCCAP